MRRENMTMKRVQQDVSHCSEGQGAWLGQSASHLSRIWSDSLRSLENLLVWQPTWSQELPTNSTLGAMLTPSVSERTERVTPRLADASIRRADSDPRDEIGPSQTGGQEGYDRLHHRKRTQRITQKIAWLPLARTMHRHTSRASTRRGRRKR